MENSEPNEQTNTKLFKLPIILFLLILVISIISLAIYFKLADKPTYKTQDSAPTGWYTTDKTYDVVTGNGNLIKTTNGLSGITILPLNHEAQSKEITATKFDITSQTESQLTLIPNATDTTRVHLLQNSNKLDNLWIVTFDQINDCKKTEPNQLSICQYRVIDYDTNTGSPISTITQQFNLTSGNSTLHSFVPLAFDHKNNNIWIAVNEINPEEKYEYYSPVLQKQISGTESAYNTNIIKYNPDKDKSEWITTDRGVNFNNKVWNYDTDSDGNLYLLTDCAINTCAYQEKDSIYYDGSLIYKIEANPTTSYGKSIVNIFDYDMDKSFLEFTIDKSSPNMYLVNNSWSSSPGSWVLRNDLSRQISYQVGLPPTDYKDDVRGIAAKDNQLLLGTFSGLAIYDASSDNWNIVKSDKGIKSNNVENVTLFNNGLCLGHETQGSSCYFGQISSLTN